LLSRWLRSLSELTTGETAAAVEGVVAAEDIMKSGGYVMGSCV
jgi:hypothetical protein